MCSYIPVPHPYFLEIISKQPLCLLWVKSLRVDLSFYVNITYSRPAWGSLVCGTHTRTHTHTHTPVHTHTPMSNLQSRPGNELQYSVPWEQFWFPVMRKRSNKMPPVDFHTCFSLSIIPPFMGFQRTGGVSYKAKKTCQEQGKFSGGQLFPENASYPLSWISAW